MSYPLERSLSCLFAVVVMMLSRLRSSDFAYLFRSIEGRIVVLHWDLVSMDLVSPLNIHLLLSCDGVTDLYLTFDYFLSLFLLVQVRIVVSAVCSDFPMHPRVSSSRIDARTT